MRWGNPEWQYMLPRKNACCFRSDHGGPPCRHIEIKMSHTGDGCSQFSSTSEAAIDVQDRRQK